MKPSAKSKSVIFRLSPAIVDALRIVSANSRKTMTAIVETALKTYFRRLAVSFNSEGRASHPVSPRLAGIPKS